MPTSVKLGRIGGIEIDVNWTWFLALLFFTWALGGEYHIMFKSWSSTSDYVVGFVSAILLFFTVLVHELAHSFTARHEGLPVNKISLFIFGGVSNLTREPDSARTELLVAIAGPLASLAQAAIFAGLHYAVASGPAQVSAVLGYLAWANVVLAIFNLVPGFPLDGGRVLRALLWMGTHSLRRATRIASDIGNVIGYLFMLGGALEWVLAGDIVQGIWLIFIGWFLHNAATASYQQVVLDKLLLGVEVRNVMDAPPEGVEANTPLQAVAYRYMIGGRQRAVPVMKGDGSFEGLLTLSDIQKIPNNDWPLMPAERVMVPADKLVTLNPDDSLKDALRILAENDYSQLPVTVRDRLVGILDRSHVMQYLHLRGELEKVREQGPSADSAPPANAANP